LNTTPAPSAADTPSTRADQAFVVHLAKSGQRIDVAADMSILEALLTAGIDVPSSCQQGVCGTCETRVVAGTPEHRDMILSDSERAANNLMMICCSRAVSAELTLDL
jgi:ferredoxin